MRFQPKPSFIRLLRSLPEPRKDSVKKAIQTLAECLEINQTPPHGLGLTMLRRPYWEIRSTLADRIFFSWRGDLIEWLYVGSHDDIRRLLKRHR